MHDMNPWLFAFLATLVLFAEYACVYAVLRLWGKLAVSPDGWHAESLELWGMPVMSALWVFRIFTLPMRAECLARRVAGRPAGKRSGEAVSEVAVELVPLA